MAKESNINFPVLLIIQQTLGNVLRLFQLNIWLLFSHHLLLLNASHLLL